MNKIILHKQAESIEFKGVKRIIVIYEVKIHYEEIHVLVARTLQHSRKNHNYLKRSNESITIKFATLGFQTHLQ